MRRIRKGNDEKNEGDGKMSSETKSGFFEHHYGENLGKQLPGQGVLLVQPLANHNHFSLYLLDNSAYTTARSVLQEVLEEEGVRVGRFWDGPPRLFSHKGRRVLRLPGLYLKPLQGLGSLVEEISPITLQLISGEVIGVPYDTLREKSLFYSADNNKDFFKRVRRQFLKQFRQGVAASLFQELLVRSVIEQPAGGSYVNGNINEYAI